MLGKIISFWQSFNQTGLKDVPLFKLPLSAIENTAASISQKDYIKADRRYAKGKKQPILSRISRISLREKQREYLNDMAENTVSIASESPGIQQGHGILPAKAPLLPRQPSGMVQAVEAALHLFVPAQPQIYAGSVPAKNSVVTSSARQLLRTGDTSRSTIYPQSAANSGEFTRPKRSLQQQEKLADLAEESLLPLPATHDVFHQPADNSSQFGQQLETFFQRMNIVLDSEQQQQLITTLEDGWMVFSAPADDRSRPRRVHEDQMRRSNMFYEMSIKDKSINKQSVGAKITQWADDMTEQGQTLFIKGTKSYNPLHFLQSGGAAVLGFFSRKVGETVSGEIFERKPGQSKADFILEWGMATTILPETQARAAFNPARVKPGSGIFKSPPAVNAAEVNLPGTVITHSPTGLTVHVVLEKKIAGQRWNLYPDSPNTGIAERVDGKQVTRQPATRDAQTNAWQIKGIEGQHIFTFGPKQQYFIQTKESYHPLSYSAADDSWTVSGLSPGNKVPKKIYFNKQAGEWREFCAANVHLNARVLSEISEALISEKPGQQRVLANWGAPSRRVWASSASDSQYLQIYTSVADNPNQIKFGYVTGQLHGDVFCITAAEGQPLYRQTVLKWHAAAQQWDVITSPFRLLQQAEATIETTKLLQSGDMAGKPVAVPDIPGLYRAGEGFFLLWQTKADGTAQYLELMPTGLTAEYRAVHSEGAGHGTIVPQVHLRYDTHAAEWRFLTLKHEAFAGLPDAVKIQPVPPLTTGDRLPWLHDAYHRQGETWLHTGSDKHGQPEYIKVWQDADDPDRFIQHLPDETQPRIYLYDENSEFVREDENLCRATRAADDQLCQPGPSGYQPPVKKSRLTQQSDAAVEKWLDENRRLPRETLTGSGDSLKNSKNLSYALRLYQMRPEAKEKILQHSDASLFWLGRRLKKLEKLQQSAPETYQDFINNKQHPDEPDLEYALRLYLESNRRDTIKPAIIQYTGVSVIRLEREIVKSQDPKIFFEKYPKGEQESDMNWALRLARLPGENMSLQTIAWYTQVDLIQLYYRIGTPYKPLASELQTWFGNYIRHPGERDLDYAVRLVGLHKEQIRQGITAAKLINNDAIAHHATITFQALDAELQRIEETRAWLNSIPRQPQEGQTAGDNNNQQYALLLVKERYLQGKPKVRNREIATHVGITPQQLTEWVQSEKFAWLNKIERQPSEIVMENDSLSTAQLKNQYYSLRLIDQRKSQNTHWLITDDDLVRYCQITLRSLEEALAPGFGEDNPQHAAPVEQEAIWQPVSGLRHLKLKKNGWLLVSAADSATSVTMRVIGEGKVEVTGLENLKRSLSRKEYQQIKIKFDAKAKELIENDGNNQDDDLSANLHVIDDEKNPGIGLQVNAKKDIDANEIIGVYTGVWHEDGDSLLNEIYKMGSQPVLTYLWGELKGPGLISAYQHANELALINTGEMAGFPSLGENNVGLGYINGKIPIYYASRKINAGEQLLIDYGSYYYPNDMIQKTLDDDIIGIIAREKECYFVIKGESKADSVFIGPDGEVDKIPPQYKGRKYILRRRLNERGILTYDTMSKKGDKVIVLGKVDENNLYCAMAKAMFPSAGLDKVNETIINLKDIARNARVEGGEIKPEPV